MTQPLIGLETTFTVTGADATAQAITDLKTAAADAQTAMAQFAAVVSDAMTAVGNMSAAAANATDSIDAVGTAAQDASVGVSAMAAAGNALVGAFMQILEIGTVVETIKQVTTLTLDADQANRRLAATIESLGGTMGQYRAQITAAEAPLKEWGFYTESQLNGALSQLVALTGNVTQSIQDLDVVVELAHWRHLDLERASLLVTKAMEGEVGMLGRYVPGLKDAADKMEFLREHLRVFAESDAESMRGALEKITTKLQEMAQHFGLALTASVNWGEALPKILTALDNIDTAVTALGQHLGGLITQLEVLHEVFTRFTPFGWLMTWLTTPKPPPPLSLEPAIVTPPLAHEMEATTIRGQAPTAEHLEIVALQEKEIAAREKLNALNGTDNETVAKRLELLVQIAEIEKKIADIEEKPEKERREEQMREADRVLKETRRKADEIYGPPTPPPVIGTTAAYGEEQVAIGAQPKGAAGTEYKQLAEGAGKEYDAIAKKNQENLKQLHEELTAPLTELKQNLTSVSETVGGAISAGIQAGMASRHDALRNAIKAAGAELLSALGGVFIDQGEALLAAGAFQVLSGVLAGQGAADIAAGTGLVALGASLKGVGSALGGGAGGGAGGAGGASAIGPATVHGRQYLNVGAGAPFAAGEQWPGHGVMQPHITVIGPGDSAAQYGMQRLLTNMVRRGMTVSGIGG